MPTAWRKIFTNSDQKDRRISRIHTGRAEGGRLDPGKCVNRAMLGGRGAPERGVLSSGRPSNCLLVRVGLLPVQKMRNLHN